MLTIPTNMQTALKKNPNQEFRYIIKIGRSLIASPYTASNFYISSNATFGTNNVGITDSIVYPVVPILLKEPDITEQLDIRAHTSTVGGFSIELDDNFLFQNPAHSNALEKFSDQLNTYNIYNRDLYIYLWLTGLTNLQTECLKVYHGIVGDVKISNNKVIIPISNSTFKVQKELPQKIINVNDHPLAPSESIGLPYSLVYGQHKYLYCNPNKSLATSVELNNLIPCRYVGLNANNKHRWVISSNKCKSINALWIYDTQLAKYTQLLSGWVIEFNNEVDGAIVRINNDPVYTDYHLSDGNVTATKYGSWATVFSNPTRAGDKAFDLATVGSINAGAGLETWIKIAIQFPEWKNQVIDDINIREIKVSLFAKYEATGLYGDPYSNWFKIECSFDDTNWEDITDQFPTDETTFENIRLTIISYNKANIGATIYLKITKIRAGAGPATTITIYEVFKSINYRSINFPQVFASVDGREASVPVANLLYSLSAGDLIEHPAAIITSLLIDEMGSTNIDVGSVNNVITELAGWKDSVNIDSFMNSKELIEKIAKQSKLFLYWNAFNKPAMDTFYAVNATDYMFHPNDIQGRPLLSKSSLSDIVNDFKLKYHKSPKGNLQLVIERANNTAGSGSQAVYNTVNELVMDADYIADETTARLLADHWCKDGDDKSFWSVLHNVIEFETVDLRGVNCWNAGVFKPILGLELTDIIELHSDWDNIMKCYGESWAGKKFKITSITRKPWSLKIKAIEL